MRKCYENFQHPVALVIVQNKNLLELYSEMQRIHQLLLLLLLLTSLQEKSFRWPTILRPVWTDLCTPSSSFILRLVWTHWFGLCTSRSGSHSPKPGTVQAVWQEKNRCPKTTSLEKWLILTPLQECGRFGQINYCQRF